MNEESKDKQEKWQDFIKKKNRLLYALCELKDSKVVDSFDISHKENRFFTYVYCTIWISKNKSDTFIVVFEEKSDSLKFKNISGQHVIYLKATPVEIKIQIQNRVDGIKKSIEKGTKKEQRVENIIKSEKKKPQSVFVYVLQGSVENDIRGKDIVIGYRPLKNYHHIIPLQVKSSFFYQKKHKEKYPDIPSIVINDLMTDEGILKKILEICQNYILSPKIILHL